MIKNNAIAFLIVVGFLYCIAGSVTAEEYGGEWHGSLMFSITDTRKIYEILDAYRREQEQLSRPKEEPQTKEEIIKELMETLNITSDRLLKDLPPEAPAFYLNSIVYEAENNWSIWVNGKRYSFYGSRNGEVTVEEVSKDKVRLSWKSKYLKYINPYWREVASKNVQVDIPNNKVYFTLRPNQTFESIRMKVVEGKQVATPLSYQQTDGGIRNQQIQDIIEGKEAAQDDMIQVEEVPLEEEKTKEIEKTEE